MKFKRFAAVLLTSIMTFAALVSCSKTTSITVEEGIENYMPVTETRMMRVLEDKTETELNLTVWSWQVPSAEYAEKYAEQAKSLGFDGIDFVVQWEKFEPSQGVFNWKYLDSVLDVFVKNDLGISLSVLFWTEGLSWKDLLDYQMTEDGEIYRYDDIRGSFLALNSEKNLAVMKNTLEYFAAHCDIKYSENITRWYIRTSVYAEMEYSPLVDLDFSPSAIEAFRKFLEEKYIAIDVFNARFDYEINAWSDLASVSGNKLASDCLYDWKLFKQQTIIDISNFYTKIFETADADIPVSLQLSSFWDTSASFYRGVFDPYIIASESKADIIQISDSPDWPHDFSVDLLTSFTDKYIAMETDGSWRGLEDFPKYISQIKTASSAGANYFNAMNWELEDLELYGSEYLSKYKEAAASPVKRDTHDESDVILINTLDFLLRQPPKDMNDLYYYAYKNMTGSGKKVRFVTDTQLIADPSILNNISKIHLGSLSDVIYMKAELGKILAESSVTLVDDTNAQPNFINEFGSPLNDEVQTKLREKLKNS